MSSPVILNMPLEPGEAAALRVGSEVLISGTVLTARDAAHRYLAERPDGDGLPFELASGIIYHCGPIVRREGERRMVVSAGPTTSMRMEMYEAAVISRYAPAAIIGKGGMGPATAAALAQAGAVYLAAPGGAGALLAKRITAVRGVWKLEEFGSPEAMWLLAVESFPAVVAMDAHGGNLYADVEEAAREALAKMLAGPLIT